MAKKNKLNRPDDHEDKSHEKETTDRSSDREENRESKDLQTEKKEKKKKSKESEPSPVISGKAAVKGLFALFGVLAVFFLFSAFFSAKTNSYSLPMLLMLAMGGFLIAFLTRQLLQSAYYNLFRILSLLLFIPIAVINYFKGDMYGFSFGFFGILAASVLITAIIPYFFEGMDIDKIALYSISIFFALGLIYLTYSSSVLDSGVKTIYRPNIYPAGVVFGKDGKTTWLYGDNQALSLEAKGPAVFQIVADMHPDEFINRNRLQKDEMVKAMGNKGKENGKKKNGKNGSPTPSPSPSMLPSPSPSTPQSNAADVRDKDFPSIELKGENFSACHDRNGEKIAIAGSKLEETGNSVLVIALPDFKKIRILENSDLQPFLPGLSKNYPGYTPWNQAGNKFFFFTYGEGGSLRLFVGDMEKESNVEVKLENILSACWVSDDELRIITGIREPVKNIDSLNVFNFDIQSGAVHNWKEGMETPEKIVDMDAGVKRIALHPLTGKIFTFDGQTMGVLNPDSTEFAKKNLSAIPGVFDSIISPDGKLLALKDGKKIIVTDLETAEMKELLSNAERAGNFTFTGDNRYLLWTDNSNGNFVYYNSNITMYDLEKNVSVKYPINFRLSDYFSGPYSSGVNNLRKMGYMYDPHNNGVYYQQTSKENVMSLWKAK